MEKKCFPRNINPTTYVLVHDIGSPPPSKNDVLVSKIILKRKNIFFQTPPSFSVIAESSFQLNSSPFFLETNRKESSKDNDRDAREVWGKMNLAGSHMKSYSVHLNDEIFSAIKCGSVRRLSKSDPSGSVSLMFNPLGKHRSPCRPWNY